MKNIVYILVAALLIPLGMKAQYNPISGQNIVQYRQFDWKYVSTEHFEIHYYSSDASLAANVARYAEEGLWDICRALDYKNKTRFAIYLFNSSVDLVQSNMFPDRQIRDAGITPIHNNTIPIVFSGTMRETQKEVKTGIARMVVEDYYFGGGVQRSIQNTVLLHLPKWYIDGFSTYLGEGWTYEDEMWLHSLENLVLTNYALDDDAFMNVFARKSIWYYISSNYGDEKLSEIFYMTRLTRSVEDGVIHVLGITLKTLTERWREFVLQRITANKVFRDEITKSGKQVEIPSDHRILGYSLNPKDHELALLLEHKGKQYLMIRDLENGIDIETPLEGGQKTDQYAPFFLDLPVAFSPDGNMVALVMYQEGEEVLAFYNTETKKVTISPYRRQLDRITDIAWSHDSKQLVCSALKNGSVNLYRFGIGGGNFAPLIDDPFENLNPAWSLDDQRIYFSSNRPNDTIQDLDFRYELYKSTYDLWELNLEDKSLRRVTNTPLTDEYALKATSSFELLVRSNFNGINNLLIKNVFVGDSSFHTNFDQGVYSADYTEREFAYLFPHKGGTALFTAKKEEIASDDYVVNTLLKNVQLKEIRNKIEAEKRKVLMDSLNKVKVLLNTPKDDTVSAEKNDKKIKYYVFDEEDNSVRATRKRFQKRKNLIQRKEPVKPDFNELVVKSPNRSSTQWSADQVKTQLGYDPVFRLNLLLEINLEDQLGDYGLVFGFRPFLDLKSSDAYFRYLNKKHRLDYSIGLERSSRFLNRAGFTSRFNSTKFGGKVALPLSRYTTISGVLNASYVNRFNIELIVPKEIDDRDVFAGANVNLIYDNRDWEENFVTRGSFARVDLTNVFSVGNTRNEFMTASFDLRKYIPLKKMVFASRVTGAWSQGINAQRFFLGGTDDWLFSQFFNSGDYPIEGNLSDFHYMQYVTPARGFQFNARNGSKYIFANAELRIPAGRIFRQVLNSNPVYNIELIPFFDFGTAWEQGNPLSQRNPIDTESIDSYPLNITVQTLKSPFIMGFGGGIRTMVLGYNIRADLGWGVEDYTILRPRLSVSLGKNF